ncbi:helix-turn-helix domain-containing protein [Actinacidiphila sp. ITFR-21]|uniref:helix-turn-helix domain-containing protein n=1 Tax=Actinacidiphila sp. ITFR-21 TaxID=3075199 RepID=UPI00288AFD6A|nr:helix-turn-helix domain-containing protein [Streptomyces sp. ITFR-21]WNI16630.1 helix-turn-helix domain-containing protein [Streptomyces sp. ITFR-21]
MPPKFPNPAPTEIRPGTLLTARQAAQHFGVGVGTIRQWQHRGKIEPVDLPGRGPHLYHLGPLALAERDAWLNGADRARRGGRHPDWKPCASAAA